MNDRAPSCIACGYSLANIGLEGLCPECGTPARNSASVSHLRDSSLAYLTSVRRGVLLQICAVVAVIGAGGLTAVASNAAASRGVSVVALVCSLVGVLGAWFIASPDPARAGDDAFNTLLGRCRMWALIDAASQSAGMVAGLFIQGKVDAIITGLSQLPAFGTLICVAKIFADLGARAGDAKLNTAARKLVKTNFWMLGGSVALTIGAFLPTTAMTIVNAGIGLYMLVNGIMFLVEYIKSIAGILRVLKPAIAFAAAREADLAPRP